MLPNVFVNITNDNLGLANANTDGVAGLLCSGTATGSWALLTPKVIYSLAGLAALGVTASNNASLYRHVSEFYSEGREGLELWIMMIVNTVTLETMADKTQANYSKKLLDASQGRIKILGITRKPDVSYEPTVTNGIDADCYAALTKADELGKAYAVINAPVSVLVEGREFSNDETQLSDLHTMTKNYAGIVLFGSANDKSSSVGLVLGRMAGNPVHRKISRVKDGALPIATCFVGTKDVASYAGVALIHDKGFITARTFPGKAGFFISDDPTATALTDDYSSFTNRNVINKAQRITYAVYIEELNDEVLIVEGKINPGTIKSLEAKIENRIRLEMAGEISDVDAYIDADQNVISQGSMNIKLGIVPVGYNKIINVNLGFANPAL